LSVAFMLAINAMRLLLYHSLSTLVRGITFVTFMPANRYNVTCVTKKCFSKFKKLK